MGFKQTYFWMGDCNGLATYNKQLERKASAARVEIIANDPMVFEWQAHIVLL